MTTTSIVGSSSSPLIVDDGNAASGQTVFDFSQGDGVLIGNALFLGAGSDSNSGNTLDSFSLDDSLILTDFAFADGVTATVSSGVLDIHDVALTEDDYFTLTSFGLNDTIDVLRDPDTGDAKLVAAAYLTDYATPNGLHTALAAVAATGVGGVIDLDGVAGQTVTVFQTCAQVGSGVKFYLDDHESVTLSGAQVINGQNGPTLSDVGGLSGTHGFAKLGGGTLTLAGDETHITGTVTVSGGILDIQEFSSCTQQPGSISSDLQFSFQTLDDGVLDSDNVRGNAQIVGTESVLAGHSFANFQFGNSVVLDGLSGRYVTKVTYGGGSSGGDLAIQVVLPDGTTTTDHITIGAGSAANFTTLIDSVNGGTLVVPVLEVGTAQALSDAVATFQTPQFAETSGDVIGFGAGNLDLSFTELDLQTEGGYDKVVRFDPEGNKVTLDGSLVGDSDFAKVGKGTLTLMGDDSGLTGTISVGGGTLDVETTLFGVSHIDFSTGTGKLAGPAANFATTTLTNFDLGDSLDLTDVAATAALANSGDVYTVGSGQTAHSITIQGTGDPLFDVITKIDDGNGHMLLVPAIEVDGDDVVLEDALDTITTEGVANGVIVFTNSVNDSSDGDLGVNPVWLDAGGNNVTLSGSLAGTNDMMVVGGGTLTLLDASQLEGTISISGGSTLDVEGPAYNGTQSDPSSATAYDLLSAGATLAGQIQALNGHTVYHVQSGDSIDITDMVFASGAMSASMSGSTLVVSNGKDTVDITLSSIVGSISPGVSDDGHGNTQVQFSPSTITVTASDLATHPSIVGNGQATLVASGGPNAIFDLTQIASLSGVREIDVQSGGLIEINDALFNSLTTIKGLSGQTLIELVSSNTNPVFQATNSNKFVNIASVELGKAGETLSVGGSITGVSSIGGASSTDVLLTNSPALDISGITFFGDGIVEAAVGNSATPTGAAFTIGDGSLVDHIQKFYGNQPITIFAKSGTSVTADAIIDGLTLGYTMVVNGQTLSSVNATFTPDITGALPAKLLTGGTSSGGVTTFTGPLTVTDAAPHLILPGGTVDLSAIDVSSSATSPVVFFGQPGGTTSLPGGMSWSAPQPVELVVNSGDNTIVARGNTTVELWGGSGNDQFSLASGGGSVVGGSGRSTIHGGTGDDTVGYGHGGAATIWGSSGGSVVDGGGNYSVIISEGGVTSVTASTSSTSLHQEFIGNTVAGGSLVSDTFILSSIAGAADIVQVGVVSTAVSVNGSNDFIAGSSGSLTITAGASSTTTENLTYIASTTSSTETTSIGGTAAATLYAKGGAGNDTFTASSEGSSTLIGGTGSTSFIGTTGDALMFSSGHSSFTFTDLNSPSTHAGRFIVSGYSTSGDTLSLVTSNFTSVAGTHQIVTIGGSGFSQLDGQTALEITLLDGQKIDFVGLATLPVQV